MLSRAKAVFRDRLRRAGYDLHPVRLDDTADYIAQYGRDAVKGRRFYNVGSGSFFHPCWTNIDFVSDWYGGVQKNVIHHDLMSPDPLPIPTGSAEIIYSSHTIEHVEETAVAKLFREAYRSLKPGGARLRDRLAYSLRYIAAGHDEIERAVRWNVRKNPRRITDAKPHGVHRLKRRLRPVA